jgi:cytochrome b pre-mRNA-processing protein 3
MVHMRHCHCIVARQYQYPSHNEPRMSMSAANRKPDDIMQLFRRLFGQSQPDPKDALRPLYAQIVAKAREPHWYLDGGVADSVDGRFEMVSVIMALATLRLERDEKEAGTTALLTELYVDDMDAQLREFGVGDMIVGKRMGKLLGAFGGRLGALREAMAGDAAALDGFIARNLFGSEAPGEPQLAHVRQGLMAAADALAQADAARIAAGEAKW